MNWLDRLNRAEKAGGFNERDRTMASHWLTCAVGERAATLRLDAFEDPSLAIEACGYHFLNAVQNDLIEEARKLFNLIQRWGARRLRQEG